MWNNDSRFPLGYFVCNTWSATETSVNLDRWKTVEFEESEFGDYLNQLEAQMCELFRLSTAIPFQHYGVVRNSATFGEVLRTIGWLDMIENFKLGSESQQFSAECWVLMQFEIGFDYWSLYNGINDDFGNFVDFDDDSTHEAMRDVKQLAMKIKVTYLHMRGIEFHDYWNYVKQYEDRVFPPAGPQDETNAYSGNSW